MRAPQRIPAWRCAAHPSEQFHREHSKGASALMLFSPSLFCENAFLMLFSTGFSLDYVLKMLFQEMPHQAKHLFSGKVLRL
jgi:hypothetical protein